jgi:hypothetical protein
MEGENMKKAVLLALAVLTAGVLAAAAVDVTGTWEYTMETQRGPMTSELIFVQTGENLAVTVKRIGRDGTPTETKGVGTVKGNEIEWKITRAGRDGAEMVTTYKGTIVDDNNMKGTMEGGMGGGGSAAPEWKAVRKPK